MRLGGASEWPGMGLVDMRAGMREVAGGIHGCAGHGWEILNHLGLGSFCVSIHI